MTELTGSLIDTHAHLDDDQFAGELDGILDRAAAAGVERIINIGYRPERWRSTLALAARYPLISYALGMHPHHVDEWSPAVEAELIGLLERNRPVALGEIGLDYLRNFNPPDEQRRVFERQLAIAAEHRLPVVIHQRHAEQDLMHVLASAPPDLVCILHSFDGTTELAEFALDRGWWIGVGGLMTRKSSSELRAVIRDVPLDRVVLETDSPYLVPAGVKQRRNEPANVAAIAAHLASEHEAPLDLVIGTTTRNANEVFKLTSDSNVCAGSMNV